MLSSPDAPLVAKMTASVPAATLQVGALPALPPLVLPFAAAPMNEAIPVAPSVAIVRTAVPAVTPDTLLSQAALAAPSAPAGPATALSPSVAPRPVEMAAALPGPAMATRPSGNPRLPRALPDADDRAFALSIATTAEAQRSFAPVRAAPQAVEMPGATNVYAPELATATDIAIRSEQLGAVRIGIEGTPGDLRVSLGLSPAAAALVAADAPRLLADLAAGGVRLQSLDVSGSGFAGGQGASQGAPQHQPQPGSAPRPAIAADPKPPTPVRVRTADRYA
jgi:hypothetical protein